MYVGNVIVNNAEEEAVERAKQEQPKQPEVTLSTSNPWPTAK
jgi:hypothetical protein